MMTIAFSALFIVRIATRMILVGFIVQGIFGFRNLPVAVLMIAVYLPVVVSGAITMYLLRPKVARAFLEPW